MSQVTILALSAVTRERLSVCGAASICNALLRRGFRNTFMVGVSPVSDQQPALVGTAYTLRFMPAREDIDTMEIYSREDSLHRRAIEECPPGSVLVIATGSDVRASSMGDMMAARLKMRGAAGVVTDGGYRDSPGIRNTGLPCFQRQASGPPTPITLHPVELNGPVGCAGVPVYPGDVVVGDGEGVVVIPGHLADEVAEEAYAAYEYEAFVAEHIARGRSIFGLFPATPQSRKEYEQWVAAGRPSME